MPTDQDRLLGGSSIVAALSESLIFNLLFEERA